MATSKRVVKKKGKALPNAPMPVGVKDLIKDVYLDEQSDRDYYIYGTSTIEDRAIVGTYDGIKPVMRRILWAMFKLGLSNRAKTIKAAKIVGDTMGNYHPHGDASIFQAAVAATQLPQPLIDGTDSNWGTMLDGNGAMRYINGRLTAYSDAVFFDPFYTPTMVFGPNYDGSYPEPVNLVTLLPNGLLNGNFGICPGVNTRTPAFTLPSVVGVLRKMLAADNVATPAMCSTLEWISDYGGYLKKTPANVAAVKEFYRTGKGAVTWSSVYEIDEVKNTLRLNRFAPISTSKVAPKGKQSPLARLLTNVEDIPGVSSIQTDGESTDPFRVAYMIRFTKTCKGAQRVAAIKRIETLFSERQTYNVKVTDRVYQEDTEETDIKLRPITVPQLLTEWLAYRIKLEVQACNYWIKKREVEIAYLNLMRLAISKLDFIFKCVRNDKLNDEQLVSAISKGLKITDAQTNQILARNLRQLRHLEDKKLVAQIKDIETEKAGYAARAKKPGPYIDKHLDGLLKKFK